MSGDTTITLHPGDNRESLRRLIAAGVRVHSVVTDPPYGLVSTTKRFGGDKAAPAKFGSDGAFARSSAGFMGSKWDGTGIERDPEFWALIWDILLPGGYCLAFSSARTGHWQACAMETAGFIMHPFFGWTYGCLDDQSECLTRRGWLKYTELTADDEVLQWDSVADCLSWVRPQAVHEYPFDGNMVMIENRHTRQMLTPNHRVYAKVRRHGRHVKPTEYEVLPADTIDRRPSNWSVDLPMAAPLHTGEHVDVDFAYLAGWWMTDAWPHKDANACMFSQCKPKTLAKLRTALEPHNASEYVKTAKSVNHSDEHTFYLTGDMANRLRSEFPERILPWSVLSWSKLARQALYEGLMDGDGSRPEGSHAETFWSQIPARRDVFMALALSLGYRAYEDAANGAICVNPNRSTTQVQGKHRSSRVPYSGKVWCLTVPTGAFVARRDGRPFITGNSGFPKAHNASKAIDRELGAAGAVNPTGNPVKRMIPGAQQNTTGDWAKTDAAEYQPGQYIPGSPEAAQWEGWAYGAQSMKPALEPIYIGQKPFSEKNGALNLLRHGVGALNIDGCRVPSPGETVGWGGAAVSGATFNADSSGLGKNGEPRPRNGRHPANLLHDGSPEVAAMFPDSKGQQARSTDANRSQVHTYGATSDNGKIYEPRNDSGSAARFFNSFPTEHDSGTEAEHPPLEPLDADPLFYHAKATKADRAGSKHPTVKPIALMRWLVRLATPPGGTVLDPFGGSGTTGAAARAEGFDCILMEAEEQFVADIRRRFGLVDPSADPFADLFDLASDPFAELVA